MRFMTLTLERIYMSGFLSISFKYEIDIFPIQSIDMSIHLHKPGDSGRNCSKLTCVSNF